MTQLVYEPIFAWLHRLDDQWAEFHRIQTGHGQVLELTALHAVYESADCRSTKGKLTYAKDIQVGQCLVMKKGNGITITTVSNVTMVQKHGIYSPLTPSGTIMANQLLASCYSNMLLPTVHQTAYRAIQILANICNWVMGSIAEPVTSSMHNVPTAVAYMASIMHDVFPSVII